MPRKKSVRRAAERFSEQATALEAYYSSIIIASGLTDQEVTWACEAALIKLNAYFEQLMLSALIGAINNNTSMLGSSTGVPFPKHLTDEVCEYIVTHGGYFDFRGRDGLIGALKEFVPESHYLVQTVKDAKYRTTLERLFALRNFAAHESRKGKKQAKTAVSMNLGSAGAWVKRQGRFLKLSSTLRDLADTIRLKAPY